MQSKVQNFWFSYSPSLTSKILYREVKDKERKQGKTKVQDRQANDAEHYSTVHNNTHTQFSEKTLAAFQWLRETQSQPNPSSPSRLFFASLARADN